MKKVYIDLGHFGEDKGILGYNYIRESDIILEIGNRLKDLLSENYIVRFSNEIGETASLSQRSSDANTWGADILISLHCNAFDCSFKGIESYVYCDDTDRKLANIIHGSIIGEGLYNKNNGVKTKNFHIVRYTNMPSCIVSLGYIDNIEDYELIIGNYSKIAEAIYSGINEYFICK